MTDLTLPWVIGPAPVIGTLASVMVFLRNLFTRRGLTAGSLFSTLTMTAFSVGYVEFLSQPPFKPWLIVALSQIGGALIFAALLLILRSVQADRKALREPDWGLLRKGLWKIVGFFAVWNGLVIVFFNSKCEDLTYRADYSKCYVGEKILGMHGPFLDVFIVVLFGVPSLYYIGFGLIGPIWKRRRGARSAVMQSDQHVGGGQNSPRTPPEQRDD